MSVARAQSPPVALAGCDVGPATAARPTTTCAAGWPVRAPPARAAPAAAPPGRGRRQRSRGSPSSRRVVAEPRRDHAGPSRSGELDPGLLARCLEPRQAGRCGRVGAMERRHPELTVDLQKGPIHEGLIQVLATEEVVAGVVHDPQTPLGGLQQRHIQGATAQVEHQPGTFAVLTPARCDGSRDGLLDQNHLVEAGELPSLHGGMVLRQLEERRRGDHRSPGPEAQRIPRIGQQGTEHQSRQLLGQEALGDTRERPRLRRSHQALEFGTHTAGIALEKALCFSPDADVASAIHPHHRRREVLTQGVGHHGDRVSVKDSQGGVGGTQIDADEHARPPRESRDCVLTERTEHRSDNRSSTEVPVFLREAQGRVSRHRLTRVRRPSSSNGFCRNASPGRRSRARPASSGL